MQRFIVFIFSRKITFSDESPWMDWERNFHTKTFTKYTFGIGFELVESLVETAINKSLKIDCGSNLKKYTYSEIFQQNGDTSQRTIKLLVTNYITRFNIRMLPFFWKNDDSTTICQLKNNIQTELDERNVRTKIF